jgi:hypothetical protein
MPIVQAAEVKLWIDVDVSDTIVDQVIAAVETSLAATHDIPDPATADVRLAVTMQVARLLQRRRTPEGIMQFGGEVAIRVNRFDPDIDRLLAPYRRLLVG